MTPGIGFSDLKIGRESPANKLNYKDYSFVKSEGMSLGCGSTVTVNQYWESHFNEELNLTIEFQSEPFPEGKKPKNKELFLSRIEVYSKKQSVCTNNNICIAKSNYSDVVAKYGPIPSNWGNKGYLKFDSEGIAFRFDKDSTLIGIEIFAAY